jgi:rod shape determining protein RodA
MFTIAQTERQPRIEWLQLLAMLGLMIVSVLFIYSATEARATGSIPWHKELFIRQIFWCVSGVSAAIVVCFLDYRSLSRWAMIGYWLVRLRRVSLPAV